MLSDKELLVLILIVAVMVMLRIVTQIKKASAEIDNASQRLDAGEDIVRALINKRKGKQNG